MISLSEWPNLGCVTAETLPMGVAVALLPGHAVQNAGRSRAINAASNLSDCQSQASMGSCGAEQGIKKMQCQS
eukprot:758265-Hanusia_phi.AAC.4